MFLLTVLPSPTSAMLKWDRDYTLYMKEELRKGCNEIDKLKLSHCCLTVRIVSCFVVMVDNLHSFVLEYNTKK